MSRQGYLIPILEQFERSAKEFTERTEGAFCQTDCEYKNNDIRNFKNARARVTYNSFVIEFKFNARGTMGLNKNILECLVYTDKSMVLCPVPLPFIVDFLNIDTPSLLCIPYISNAEGMKEAFRSIESALDAAFEGIRNISEVTERKISLYKYLIDETEKVLKVGFPMTSGEYARKTVCNPDDERFYPDEYFYSWVCLRFSSSAFVNSYADRLDKSIKELEKQKDKFAYEERILRIWKSGELSDRVPLDSLVRNSKSFDAIGLPKDDAKELFAFFFSWIILSLVTSPVYLAVSFGLCFLEGRASVYLMGPIYCVPFPFCICMGFVTAIVISYFTRHRFYKLFYKRSYEHYAEMDNMINGEGSVRFMKGFTRLIVIGCLVTCVLLSKYNLNFGKEGFTDNSKFWSVRGEYYKYSEIDYVYYKPYLVNDFGERLDNPSYVIVLKDGREIDTYGLDNAEKCEEKIIGYLIDKGVEIRK